MNSSPRTSRAFVIAAFATLNLVACKGNTNNPFHAAATANKARELQGVFHTRCGGAKSAGVLESLLIGQHGLSRGIKSQNTRLEFDGDRVTLTDTVYADENCERATASVSEIGQFKVGPASTEPKQLRNLDITFHKVEASFHDQDAAAAANKIGWCGHSDWKENSEKVDVKRSAGDYTCLRAEYRDGQRRWANAYRTDGDRLILADVSKAIVETSERPQRESTTIFFK